MTRASPTAALHFFIRILSSHSQCDSAACGELRGDNGLARRACFHKIIQDAVSDCFVEGSLVSIRRKIKFERLALDAETVRNVIDFDPGKIGLASDRADGGEIIRFKMNPVDSLGRRIWKSLEPRLSWRGGNFCYGSSEQC